jgi:hypothetical protein
VTFGDMARSLGLQVDGHVLYTDRERRATRPVIAAPETGWPVDWWLGRTVRFNGAMHVVTEADGSTLHFGSHVMSVNEASARLRRGSLEVL